MSSNCFPTRRSSSTLPAARQDHLVSIRHWSLAFPQSPSPSPPAQFYWACWRVACYSVVAEHVPRAAAHFARLHNERALRPTRSRGDVMDEIARVSGGRSVKATELADLITEIKSLPEPEPLTRRLRIWANPIWAGSIVLLLGLFWSGRKMVGQV